MSWNYDDRPPKTRCRKTSFQDNRSAIVPPVSSPAFQLSEILLHLFWINQLIMKWLMMVLFSYCWLYPYGKLITNISLDYVNSKINELNGRFSIAPHQITRGYGSPWLWLCPQWVPWASCGLNCCHVSCAARWAMSSRGSGRSQRSAALDQRKLERSWGIQPSAWKQLGNMLPYIVEDVNWLIHTDTHIHIYI